MKDMSHILTVYRFNIVVHLRKKLVSVLTCITAMLNSHSPVSLPLSCSLPNSFYKYMYQITLFKGMLIIKMHLHELAGGAAEIIDSETESMQPRSSYIFYPPMFNSASSVVSKKKRAELACTSHLTLN